MGNPIASSMLSFSILPAILMSISGPVFAQADDIDSLKAKISELQETVDNTMQGRQFLFDELSAANVRVEVVEAALEQQQIQSTGALDDLQKQLEHAIIGRDYLAERLEREAIESAAIAQTLERRLDVAANGQNFMTDRLSQVLEEKAANEASLKLQLEKITVGRDYLAERLKATLEEKATNEAVLINDLNKATIGRDFLAVRAKEILAESAAKDVEINQIAEVSFVQINSAIAQRNAARNKIAELETELDNMAEVAFAQINSAIAERNAAKESLMSATSISADNSWAVARSEQLSGSFAGFAEVSATEDNRVSIEIGNNGLFESGGTNLSENGENVLLRLGDVLAEMKDTHITVTGHTDNRPVARGGRYASNAELSFARAASALRYLNRNAGISAEVLSASGLGDRYPITTNNTTEGRSANRRVEILLSQR